MKTRSIILLFLVISVTISLYISAFTVNPRQVLYREFGSHQVVEIYEQKEIIFNGKKQLQTEYLIQLPDSSLRYVIVVEDSIIANL